MGSTPSQAEPSEVSRLPDEPRRSPSSAACELPRQKCGVGSTHFRHPSHFRSVRTVLPSRRSSPALGNPPHGAARMTGRYSSLSDVRAGPIRGAPQRASARASDGSRDPTTPHDGSPILESPRWERSLLGTSHTRPQGRVWLFRPCEGSDSVCRAGLRTKRAARPQPPIAARCMPCGIAGSAVSTIVATGYAHASTANAPAGR